MAVYDHRKIEAKWRKRWIEAGIYQPDLRASKTSFYNLMMFPYPSAEGLHVGNMYAFTGADVYGRFQRMQGKDVFEPIGLDGFGIHSENYAIKIGKHPAEQAKVSKKRFYDQLSQIGNGFSWDQRLETFDPEYYRWTQWLFVQMFKHGLAERKAAKVNWCPSCKTVLADEQVEDGVCERCKTPVERKAMEQWFFKITEYADRLLANIDGQKAQTQSEPDTSEVSLAAKSGNSSTSEVRRRETTFGPVGKGYEPSRDGLHWPEKIKSAQRNWIGRSEGAEVAWEVEGSKEPIWTFTTRLDTLFGATFLVLAPEHEAVAKLLSSNRKVQSSKREEVREYVEAALKKTEQKRRAAEKEKTGVDTGLVAEHPLTGKDIPIWVADFVLKEYGSGAVMGVPGHDQRDHDFARKHKLPIVKVINVDGRGVHREAVEEYGTLVNSGEFDGLPSEEAMKKILQTLKNKKLGREKITYHLRDWLISRQRYWGPPIPMVHCTKCGWQPVAEEDLPVLLPEMKNEDVKPSGDGRAPLEKAPESWLYTECPECGGRAKRETDVSDTFLDSSWYFLRYPSIGQNSKHEALRHSSGQARNSDFELPWDREITRRWLPVDAYIGGAEHAVLHLLYSRFVWMCLYDWGYFDFPAESSARGQKHSGGPATVRQRPLGWEEPFPFLFSHGLLIKDGAKMSKSRGNVVVPDDYISKFGSDTLRTYLMFLGPYDQGGDFRDTGIAGMYRFLMRVWRLYQKGIPQRSGSSHPARSARDDTADLKSVSAVSKIGERTDQAMIGPLHRTIRKVTKDISRFRFNTAIAALMEFVNAWEDGGGLSREDANIFLKLFAPFSPHMSEELWQNTQRIAFSVQRNEYRSIHTETWPAFDEGLAAREEVEIPVQVNGKLRGKVVLSASVATDREAVVLLAKKHERVEQYLRGKTLEKTIWVPGKLVNFVVS